MDVPQNFTTKLTVWLQKTATGSLFVSGYFYLKYLFTTKREA